MKIVFDTATPLQVRFIQTEVTFGDDDLARLVTEEAFSKELPPGVTKAYRKRIFVIQSVSDEREFYAFRSLHFEKLKGKRQGQYSMRLNDQYRLILELVGDGRDKRVHIVEVTDYH